MAVIAIDWDNTIALPDGKPLDGAKNAIATFRAAGHKVIIHSCNNIDWIKRNLAEWGTPVDGVWGELGIESKKPLADLYIDDKGYHHPHNTEWTDLEVALVLERLLGKDNRKW